MSGGGVSEPEFVRLAHPGELFQRRAARFAALATGNPLGPYLDFLSQVAHAQHRAQAGAPPPARHHERVAQRLEHRMPALDKDDLSADFDALLGRFLEEARIDAAPAPAEQARQRLAAMASPDRLSLAGSIFDGIYLPELLGETLYVAAALQVHLAGLAAQLDPASLRPIADGVCPGCGSPPVASLLVDWAGGGRARYCCCALCGTLWNYLRVKCTSCASEEGIEYFSIEDGATDVSVETCSVCRSYIKHLHQDRTPAIEPFTDDIASLALDIKIQEQSFQRSCANPFLIAA